MNSRWIGSQLLAGSAVAHALRASSSSLPTVTTLTSNYRLQVRKALASGENQEVFEETVRVFVAQRRSLGERLEEGYGHSVGVYVG